MQIRIYFLAIYLMVGSLLSGCGPSDKNNANKNEIKGSVSISGAFALYPLTVKWADEFQKLHPGIRIDISAGGAGKGMADALSEMVDLGMFSRSISPEEKAQGCWWIAVAKDAVLPTVNANNPWLDQLKKTGISREVFENIYLSDKKLDWNEIVKTNEKHSLNVYTRSDACGAAQMWGEFLGKDQESLGGIGVFGDPGMADAVKRDRFGIGYNNVIYVYDLKTRKCYEGLEVIPIDLNDNRKIDEDENFYSTIDEIMMAIGDEKYPSPPARDLYFVANGKPKNMATLLFLNWVLSGGQNLVNDAGYVWLSEGKIQSERLKLNP
ncbi:MAG: PstS family phosphate ABC transporter substrate-binding protein [Bacteroidales bacterium]|nr:PstS family phosphate ABC transporter substrate-binding protein [Bacteroidales bacterium]